MKHYELVIVIDANLSAKEMKEVSTKVEALLGKGIVETDTIGLLPTAYPIG
jgi:ribosomal protein S6